MEGDSSAVFSQRNTYYLRVSPYTVIQMVLYLDSRHVNWMNEEGFHVFARMMEKLRPRCVQSLLGDKHAG